MRQTFTDHQVETVRYAGQITAAVDGKNRLMDVNAPAQNASPWHLFSLGLTDRLLWRLPEHHPESRSRCRPSACRSGFRPNRSGIVPVVAKPGIGSWRSKR